MATNSIDLEKTAPRAVQKRLNDSDLISAAPQTAYTRFVIFCYHDQHHAHLADSYLAFCVCCESKLRNAPVLRGHRGRIDLAST